MHSGLGIDASNKSYFSSHTSFIGRRNINLIISRVDFSNLARGLPSLNLNFDVTKLCTLHSSTNTIETLANISSSCRHKIITKIIE